MPLIISRRQFLVGAPLVAAAIGAARISAKAAPTPLMRMPFQAGSMGYTCYRTPGLAITNNGTVLAFCGGRLDNCKDDGDHDIVLRRSMDGGHSWGPLQVLFNDGKNRYDIPVPVVLPGGRVLLLMVWNTYVRRKEDRGERRVLVCHSDNHGLTWSAARDITEQVRLPGWKSWYGLGPGHGFVKQLPPSAGRIVIPARHGEESVGGRSHIIISDDGGTTWRVGAQAEGPNNSSEATSCELSDGSIMINSRGNTGHRIVTISSDGGISSSQTFQDRNLIEPKNGCQASLLTYKLMATTGKSIILFSNPANYQFRTNGRLRLSHDDGRTWTRGYPYQEGYEAFTGYSDLARFNNGDVALLFESGASYRKGEFADALKDESVHYGYARRSKQGKGKEKREGRTDNRHDGIVFKRLPFSAIELAV